MTIGQTPFIGRIARRQSTTIRITSPGDQQQHFMLQTRTSPVFWGNILLGGLPGSTTDMITGAAFEYSPNVYFVHLHENNQSQGDFDAEYRLRYFAMMNHSHIALDINGDGEYLNALADLMSRRMERDEAIEAIKVALDDSQGYQLAFGDALVKSFRQHD
jgi:hypothetical protein